MRRRSQNWLQQRIMWPLLLAALKSPLLQRIAVAALAAFALFNWGVSSCNSKHARKAAEAREEWAKDKEAAEAAAYQRGLQRAQNDETNDRSADQIARDAGMELRAGESCLSGNTLERLRDFQ